MRLRYQALIALILTGCAQPKTIENRQSVDLPEDSIKATIKNPTEKDSLSYIGYIGKNEDNNTFYTDLYFVDNFDYDLYNEVKKLGDLVVFQDDQITRTRLNLDVAEKYFNLTGLKFINIYNVKNQKLTSGQLSHIEYVEDMIEGRFVAVFNVENPYINGGEFCIGNPQNSVSKIDITVYSDEKLDDELITFLGLKTEHVWQSNHYQLDNKLISTISADTTAYIVEKSENSYITLYKSEYNEAINELTVVSKLINGRPIFLTASGMPETDMTWTSLLIFDGKEYKISTGSRINAE